MMHPIKILFVCGGLEPGMDGVGDYTRLLARELAERGHECSLLALTDGHVDKATLSDAGDGKKKIESLRLPASFSWLDQVQEAKRFREKVAPEWVSWQIVLYAYDPRGLSFGLGQRCRDISGNCRTHVMFHEIWIGEAKESALKNKLIGKVQRYIVKDILLRLQPSVVHTHTPLYKHLLGGIGCQATLLPLFGNIPIARKIDSDWLKKKWPELGEIIEKEGRNTWWIFMIYGSIHPEWDANAFRVAATEAAQRLGKKCAFISIGRAGREGEQMMRELQKYEGDTWRVLLLGKQSEEDISQGLLMADYGVSAVPPEYLFKSGTAASMLEHGLPIIAMRPSYHYAKCPPEKLAIRVKNFKRDFQLGDTKKSESGSLLPQVADQFIKNLSD